MSHQTTESLELIDSEASTFIFPCSFAQRRLWLIDQIQPGTGAYNIPCAVKLKGRLDVDALRRSLNEIVRRHEVLRTTFIAVDGEPCQLVHEFTDLQITSIDLTHAETCQRQLRVQEIVDEETRRGFDLATGPLIRVHLIKLDDAEHVLTLVMHHIISDGWSIEIIVKEISQLYFAFAAGGQSPLPELPIQYADYAVWQRDWLQGEVLESRLQYWKNQFEREPELLELPADRARPSEASYRGASEGFHFSQELTGKLKHLSRQEGVTLFMSLMAGFQLLLARYSGQREIAVGTPVAGRDEVELEDLIGLFINTLVIKVDVERNLTVSELLSRVRTAALGAYAHQDMPFETLIEEIHPERTLSHQPLFQVWFVLQNVPAAKVDLAELSMEIFPTEDSFTKFDLMLSIIEGPRGLSGSLRYSTDLFDSSRIKRMLAHFKRVLEGIAENENSRVFELALMSEEERQEIIVEWNQTEADYPRDHCVHELFEQQVEMTPDAVAVVYEAEQLTYEELNRRANQLAHFLRMMGVGPEVNVGLCVDRSLEMIVGLLGVMKAGGAYLPLEPDFPLERLAYMIEDGQCPVTIVTSSAVDKLRGINTALVILDTDCEQIAQQPDHNPDAAVLPDNSAYVIYTSGSTGRPKGVEVCHRQLVNYSTAIIDKLKPAAGASFALISTIAADLGNTMLFPSLLGGGCLHIISKERAWDAHATADYFTNEQIDYLKIVPSHLRALNQAGTGVLPNRVLVIGGEASSASWIKQWRRQKEGLRILNHYGPTEATVGVLTQEVERGERWETGSGQVVLGRPMRNAQVYILDEQQEAVPVGVAGEVYIGGEGVARGYVRRGAETAERFVPNPYGAESGRRMYRTGDRGRQEEDGKVEYLGRVDDQVKVRGYRIELGEIEAAIGEHPAIEQAVVVAREDEPGDKRLVGYVVAKQEVSQSELKEYLRDRLPEYMVPAVIVELDEMPLTTNGKIDRRALPSPQPAQTGSHYVAPRTDLEQVLCDIWEQVLGLEPVGVEDNFFELGGDSILSIQVIARARQAGLRLTPRQFFERQTIAGLAELAELARQSVAERGEQGELVGEVPLTPIQREFFERRLGSVDHYNQSVMLEVGERVDSRKLEEAVKGLVRQHDALRMSYEQKQGEWRQEYVRGVDEGIYRRVDLRRVDKRERVKEMEEDASRQQASLRLSEGRVITAVEYDLGEGGRRLVVVVHHLCVDGVSWRILLEDLQRGYEQQERGEEVELGEKTTSYRQWAGRLERYSQSEELKQEVEYWVSQQSQEAVQEEEERPSVASARSERRWMSEERTKELLQEVPGVYHTQIQDVLLTVMWEANRRWKGERRVVVELEGHGREELFEEVDVSRTVGWFTTIYPVKLEADSEKVWEVLKQIKELVRAIPSRGIGYGLLRYVSEDKEVSERMRGGAKAGMRFNYLGQFDQVLREGGMLRLAGESSGASQSADNRMSREVDVSGAVIGGRLRMEWVYSEKEHSQEEMGELADHYMEALEELIEHCLAEGSGGYTVSDFPLSGLEQGELERVLAARGQVEDIYVMTGMQQGMMFHTLYEGGAATYYEQMSCRIEGEVDEEAFKRAWQAVVDRHSVLRTSFVWEGVSQPVQVVQSSLKINFRQQDWRGCTAGEQSRRLEELLRQDREEGFDLTKAPLMKVGLVRVAEQGYYFIWANHHILFDGWCRELIVGEVFKLYEAYSRGTEAELGRVRAYRDYIAWLGEQDLEGAQRYWSEELRGIEGPTSLGIERSVSGEQGSYEERSERMSEEVSRRLEEVARGWRVTMNVMVEGAWSVVMSRYSGQREVVFGVTVSGRGGGLRGIEGMVGLFINTLPMKVEVRGEETVRDLMRRVQEKQAKLLEYEHSPLMQVQGWSGVGRGERLFDVIYVFQNYPADAGMSERAGEELRISEYKERSKNNYGMTVRGIPGKELVLNVMYGRERYEVERMEVLLKQLKRVLEGMAENEQARVMELSMMSEEERQEVLVAWNETAEITSERCVHELFEQQVEMRPEATAVIYEGGHLTYADLNRRANQLAHCLRSKGVGAEVKVGLCVDRSLEMIVALLGVMKAGGVYVPIDPGYPEERIRYMLRDSRAKVVVVHEKFKELVGDECANVVALEQTSEWIKEENWKNLDVDVSGKNLAYVIYTSGSTGQPKGCEVNHLNVARLFKVTESLFEFNESDVWTLFHSYTFDFSVWEIWGALAYGGRLIVVPGAVIRSPERFHDLLSEQEVTVLNQTPLAFRHLAQFDKEIDGALTALRWVVFGGDSLDFTSLRPWFERYGDERPKLVNMYGITETTVHVTHYEIRGEDAEAPTSRIGRQLPDLRLYILDRNLEPTPIGIAGELFVGGAGVARGYLNRGDVTADRFIPDQFSQEPGARLYRTGDLARYIADRAIEYLGRIDNQVKIRGYRIELGEIEAAIGEHPAVEQAVVLAREDEPGEKRLVGYVIGNQQINSNELREYLRERLPDYMVPVAIVQLDQMPLTSNGKLDRRALPKPEPGRASSEYVAPRTAAEEILCAIWKRVLKIGSVSILDNLFTLGADSLRVMEAVSLAKDSGLQLTARQFFETQTVKELARLCQDTSEEANEAVGAMLVPARANGSKSPLFFVHPAGGGVDFLWPIAHHLEPDQPAYAFRSRGLSQTEIYKPDLEVAAAEYIDLMKAVQPRGPYLIGGISLGVYFAFEMARQLQNRGEAVSLLALIDAGPSDAENLRDMVARFPLDLAARFAVDLSPDEISSFDTDSSVNYVLEKIRANTSDSDYSQITRIAFAWYGNLWSAERYVSRALADARSYLYTGRITLLRTGEDDESMGWSKMSSQAVAINRLPGTHGGLLLEPNVGFLARMLTRAIANTNQATLEAAS